MSTSKQTTYKSYSITTRWAELMSSGTFPNTRRAKSFDANFSVQCAPPDEEGWQQFLSAVFATSDAAEANALAVAKMSIDELPSCARSVRDLALDLHHSHLRRVSPKEPTGSPRGILLKKSVIGTGSVLPGRLPRLAVHLYSSEPSLSIRF